MVSRLPEADAVLAQANTWTARHGDANLHNAFDLVAETQLAGLESRHGAAPEMVGPDLGAAGAQGHRIVGLLEGLSDEAAPPARRVRLAAIWHRLNFCCRARFANSLAGEFLAPLHQMLQAPEPGALQRLETIARQLRALATEAWRLGSAPTYDTLLRQTAVVVRNVASDAGLALVEKVRLIEILAWVGGGAHVVDMRRAAILRTLTA